MIAFRNYPFYLIAFWYKDVLSALFNFFIDFNRYIAALLSVPLLLRTFFKPLKNEYRDGLVLFSIVCGIVIKTVLLSVSILIIVTILFVEFLLGLFLVVLPLLLIFLLFQKIA